MTLPIQRHDQIQLQFSRISQYQYFLYSFSKTKSVNEKGKRGAYTLLFDKL